MELRNTFTIPVRIDEAWQVLQDVERIAPCLPGASLESVEGEEFSGKVKVKVGPITVTYRGSARFVERDEAAYRAVLEGSGKEARGSGTAKATVTTQLTADGDRTDVSVVTDLAVTGKPAQFGRGVMADVATKLVDRFASCLAEELQSSVPPGGATSEAAPEPVAEDPSTLPAGTRPEMDEQQPAREAEAIDLFEVAGGSVGRRLAPVAAVGALVVLVVWLLRRRR